MPPIGRRRRAMGVGGQRKRRAMGIGGQLTNPFGPLAQILKTPACRKCLQELKTTAIQTVKKRKKKRKGGRRLGLRGIRQLSRLRGVRQLDRLIRKPNPFFTRGRGLRAAGGGFRVCANQGVGSGVSILRPNSAGRGLVRAGERRGRGLRRANERAPEK